MAKNLDFINFFAIFLALLIVMLYNKYITIGGAYGNNTSKG